MFDKLEKIINENLADMNLVVDSIKYKGNELNIVLDSDEIIDINLIVKASKIINKIVDDEDIIKEKYVLDISSKEKGDL